MTELLCFYAISIRFNGDRIGLIVRSRFPDGRIDSSRLLVPSYNWAWCSQNLPTWGKHPHVSMVSLESQVSQLSSSCFYATSVGRALVYSLSLRLYYCAFMPLVSDLMETTLPHWPDSEVAVSG
ncbi:hypothetical protein AVEN_241417-1 [Araneus ventricosus]|uniref:Uncharacterized protein n=1 Tax=Araneus ventricosus TaxID=182803 RepID=A0A4Y2RWI0_ARAVE|nr:hypothetical protein AVEN_241417-1 [Araneus ventricosus]